MNVWIISTIEIVCVVIAYYVGRYNKRKAYMQGLHDGSRGRATPGIPWEEGEKE